MKFRKIPWAASIVAAGALTLATSASAGLVFDSSILTPAQGFGTAPRDLTLSSEGNATTESGGIGVSNTGQILFGSVIPDASVYLGNGVSNTTGTSSMPSPLADDQKYGIPTIGSLGITTASQIGVLFNATEPGGDGANVLDLTLKFYTAAGSFLGAINGAYNFATSTNPGNGVAGFTFVVDAPQQAQVNSWLSTGGSSTTMALESTITNVAGGPETYLIYNLGTVAAVPEPQTYALMLAGLGAIGFMVRRRRVV